MAKLSPTEIQQALQELTGWQERDGELSRTFKFNAFGEGIEFVNRVAEMAEQAEHHPDILIKYNQVTITLTTHDEGGISPKDITLAKQITSAAS